MASRLRARLNAMAAASGASSQSAPRKGLMRYAVRLPVEPGLDTLSATGLRRIGWSGRAFAAEKCLFLDTETTGLSGGAGTIAFLVGAGYLEDGAFVVEQFLMGDYADEPELIDCLANLMERFSCVCTFNGRNFDMPLLETRFTMCRMRHRWQEMENLDLLYPARRIWKLRLGSCRLSRLEEQVLGLSRTDDLPGSQVPERYFQYLKSGDLTLLEDIVRHNRQDIATLATLLVRLCEIYDAPEQLDERKDLFSAGKALERQGELQPARELYRISAIPPPAGTLAALTGERIAGMANWRLYLIARRSGDVESMRTVLTQMLSRGQMTCAVNTELSKLYEHRLHDLNRALECARRARERCAEEEIEALEHRIRRLEEKLKRDMEE